MVPYTSGFHQIKNMGPQNGKGAQLRDKKCLICLRVGTRMSVC